MSWETSSAYQGRGWRPRKTSHREEMSTPRGPWASFQVNSEWAALKTVALYRPGPELGRIKNPDQAQHLGPVSVTRIQKEYREIAATYRKLGISVVEISALPHLTKSTPPNLMFARDLFLGTPDGFVIARMASRVRAGEEKFAAAALSHAGAPIISTITGQGLFEGADALWLNPKTLLVGVGNRTNREALRQLKSTLQDVLCVPVPMPPGVQHLLGLLQLVDRTTAVLRVKKAPRVLVHLLKRHKIKIIPVQETDEVRIKQGMNFVTIGPRTIVMASGCPELKVLLRRAGLKVAAEVNITQYCMAAGGLACATGILSRRLLR